MRIPAADLRTLRALTWCVTPIDAGILRVWRVGLRAGVEHLFCEVCVELQALASERDLRGPLPITQTGLADALELTLNLINRALQDLRARTSFPRRSSTLMIETWDELLRLSKFDPTYLRWEKRATG